MEPLVREAMERLLPDSRLGAARHVGSYWGRNNTPQVDLVGTEHRADNQRVEFAGSIKWRTGKAFDAHDTDALDRVAEAIPGWESAAMRTGVSRTGFAQDTSLDLQITPADLMAAWR